MRKYVSSVALCAAFAAILAGCNGGNLAPVAASLTPAVLPPDQLAVVQQMCQAAQPMLAVASAPNIPAEVHDTAIYGAAYCGQLLAGTVPPTTDANTPSWLPQVIEATKVAAQVAGIVLPLIL